MIEKAKGEDLKKRLLIMTKFICFVLIFLALFQRISLAILCWGTPEGDPDRHAALFFSLPKDSIDVLFLGTSHVYCSYIPTQIEEETGIRSAILATSSQSYQNSYWLLKEALKKQSPKAVVMDIHSITSAVDDQVKNFKLHYTSGVTNMPDLSLNKPRAYLDIKKNGGGVGENISLYDVYAFFEFRNDIRRGHSVQELLQLMIDPLSAYGDRGFFKTTSVYPLSEIRPGVTGETYVDMKETVDFIYLEKIYRLTEEKGIELILARAPYNYDLDDCHLFEQAFAWADENGIPLVDYFDLIEETGIDLETDFRDRDHLNMWGAPKATGYMGRFLKERLVE